MDCGRRSPITAIRQWSALTGTGVSVISVKKLEQKTLRGRLTLGLIHRKEILLHVQI